MGRLRVLSGREACSILAGNGFVEARKRGSHIVMQRRVGRSTVRVAEEGNVVKCAICNVGETRPGKATVTLTRDQLTLVVKGVPARVCDNCGEEYVDEATSATLLMLADDAVKAGVEVDVRQYVAA